MILDDFKVKPSEQPKVTTPNLLELQPIASQGPTKEEINRRASEILRSGLQPVLPDIAIDKEPSDPKARSDFWMNRLESAKDKNGYLSVAEVEEAGKRASNKSMADILRRNYSNIRNLSDDELLPDREISTKDLEIMFSIENKLKDKAENFKTKHPKLNDKGQEALTDLLSSLATNDMYSFSRRVIVLEKSEQRGDVLTALQEELKGSQLRVSYNDKSVKLQHRIPVADLPGISMTFGNDGITDYYTGSRRNRRGPDFTFNQVSSDTMEHLRK